MDRIDELSALVAVAEEGSFVAAARRLGRSPAAITRQIAALERRLRTRLFTRTTRAVVLTDAGRRHLATGGEILAALARLESDAARAQDDPRGAVAVTASIVFGRLHVLPVVGDFLRRYPSIDVRLMLTDEIVSLVEAGIDVGVRIAHLPDSSLKAVRVGSVRRVLCASPAYLAARGEPCVPADLRQHACIAFTGSTPAPERWSVGSGKRKSVIAIQPRLVLNLAEPAIDAAKAGLGVVSVLSYMVDHLFAADLLRPVLTAYEPPPIPVHVVHPAGAHLPRKTRLFADELVERLRSKFTRS